MLISVSYDNLGPKIKKLWSTCEIRPEKLNQVKHVHEKIHAGIARYKIAESLTGVPWFIIGLIHNMEASCRWDTYLGNGQPLNRVTTIVPIGRGPFKTWEEGAVDALSTGRWAGVNKDTPIERLLYLLESYNGWGYEGKLPEGQGTPYLWSFTNKYVKGLYWPDHVFNSEKISDQVGCACPLKLHLTEEVPSIAGKWDTTIFFSKVENLLEDPTPERLKDMKEVVWPVAQAKITALIKG